MRVFAVCFVRVVEHVPRDRSPSRCCGQKNAYYGARCVCSRYTINQDSFCSCSNVSSVTINSSRLSSSVIGGVALVGCEIPGLGTATDSMDFVHLSKQYGNPFHSLPWVLGHLFFIPCFTVREAFHPTNHLWPCRHDSISVEGK